MLLVIYMVIWLLNSILLVTYWMMITYMTTINYHMKIYAQEWVKRMMNVTLYLDRNM